MEIVRQLNRYFKAQGIAVRYSILKEPKLKYLMEIDERLEAWLQEVGAIRKGRGIHPVAKLKWEGIGQRCPKSVQLRFSEGYTGRAEQFPQDRSGCDNDAYEI